jgi:hypothetical protein
MWLKFGLISGGIWLLITLGLNVLVAIITNGNKSNASILINACNGIFELIIFYVINYFVFKIIVIRSAGIDNSKNVTLENITPFKLWWWYTWRMLLLIFAVVIIQYFDNLLITIKYAAEIISIATNLIIIFGSYYIFKLLFTLKHKNFSVTLTQIDKV